MKWVRGEYPKKYKVLLSNNKIVQFGDQRYEHYKDRTPLKLYSYLDHRDKERRKKYIARHKKIMRNGKPAYQQRFTPSWFSWNYLWF